MASQWTDRVRQIVLKMVNRPGSNPMRLRDEDNLLESGFIDSTEFFELISLLETELKVTIDLLEAEPADLVSIAGLARHISTTQQVAN